MADRAGFENQCALRGTAGSNPALSVMLLRVAASARTSGTCSVFSIFDGPIALELPSEGESSLLSLDAGEADSANAIIARWLSSSCR